MDYIVKEPQKLIERAVKAAPALLKAWRRKGRPKIGETKPTGQGWHELLSNEFAGSHASSAALKLLLTPEFPLPAKTRQEWVTGVAVGVLLPFLSGDVSKASHNDKERLLEAQHCTVKVANFLSACAALAASRDHRQTYKQLQPLTHATVKRLLDARQNGGWSHWLHHRHKEPLRIFPTAAAYDALHRLGQADSEVENIASKPVREYVASVFVRFRDLLTQHGEHPPPLELWNLLPALRTIAHMKGDRLDAAPTDFPASQSNFERILNAYLSHELFGFGLNHTDDFQKYRLDKKASGTDYVAFNTTACLVRSIIAAVRDDKVHRGFAEWIAPHLCSWAEQIVSQTLPQPARFSYIHQVLSCLLAAAALPRKAPCIPNRIRMNVFPRVFSKHSFARKPAQGFYITPFGFPETPGMITNSDALFSEFKTICEAFSASIGKLSLIRGDHTQSGVITERIWQYINESQFIIGICIGANANVYYEIGVADTLGKPVLLIGRKYKLPKRRVADALAKSDFKFDIAGIYHHEFEDNQFNTLNLRPVVHAFLNKVYSP